MGEVEQEISIAIEKLSLLNDQINKLDYENGKKIYHELLNFFVKSGDRRMKPIIQFMIANPQLLD